MKSMINSHHKKIIHPPSNTGNRNCNGIVKTLCLLKLKCFRNKFLHQAKTIQVDENSQPKTSVSYAKRD